MNDLDRNPYPHVNTVTAVKMSELIITSSAYIIPGDSPMTSVANTVAMTTLAVHTLQPLIFYSSLLYRGPGCDRVCLWGVRMPLLRPCQVDYGMERQGWLHVYRRVHAGRLPSR